VSKIKVVFDTNILFSGTGWRGSPFYCLQLARQGKVTVLVCREILAEYHEKLQTKLGMTPTQATRAAAEILSFSTLIEISGSLQVVLDDPDDDKVIECAVTGKATYIVSGDHHLLDMNEYNSIPIVRASSLSERAILPQISPTSTDFSAKKLSESPHFSSKNSPNLGSRIALRQTARNFIELMEAQVE